jgi:hypothetical protein
VSGRPLSDGDIIGEIRRQVFELPTPRLAVTEHRVFVYRSGGQTVQAETVRRETKAFMVDRSKTQHATDEESSTMQRSVPDKRLA